MSYIFLFAYNIINTVFNNGCGDSSLILKTDFSSSWIESGVWGPQTGVGAFGTGVEPNDLNVY